MTPEDYEFHQATFNVLRRLMESKKPTDDDVELCQELIRHQKGMLSTYGRWLQGKKEQHK